MKSLESSSYELPSVLSWLRSAAAHYDRVAQFIAFQARGIASHFDDYIDSFFGFIDAKRASTEAGIEVLEAAKSGNSVRTGTAQVAHAAALNHEKDIGSRFMLELSREQRDCPED